MFDLESKGYNKTIPLYPIFKYSNNKIFLIQMQHLFKAKLLQLAITNEKKLEMMQYGH